MSVASDRQVEKPSHGAYAGSIIVKSRQTNTQAVRVVRGKNSPDGSGYTTITVSNSFIALQSVMQE
jgi:hypothetical protein